MLYVIMEYMCSNERGKTWKKKNKMRINEEKKNEENAS